VLAAELATLRPLNDCRNQPPAEKSGPSVTRPGFLVKALAFSGGCLARWPWNPTLGRTGGIECAIKLLAPSKHNCSAFARIKSASPLRSKEGGGGGGDFRSVIKIKIDSEDF
jgi:hypothetical protein